MSLAGTRGWRGRAATDTFLHLERVGVLPRCQPCTAGGGGGCQQRDQQAGQPWPPPHSFQTQSLARIAVLCGLQGWPAPAPLDWQPRRSRGLRKKGWGRGQGRAVELKGHRSQRAADGHAVEPAAGRLETGTQDTGIWGPGTVVRGLESRGPRAEARSTGGLADTELRPRVGSPVGRERATGAPQGRVARKLGAGGRKVWRAAARGTGGQRGPRARAATPRLCVQGGSAPEWKRPPA